MPVRTVRYDSADYLGTEESATAFAAAVLEDGDGLPPEEMLDTIARGLGLSAIARIAGLDHGAVCMSLKSGDLLPGELTARDVLEALSRRDTAPAAPETRP